MKKKTKDSSKNDYNNISTDDLFLFAIKKIADVRETATFERIVAECFLNFPEKFSLVNYPQWPDSVRVTRCWSRARGDRGTIIGSSKSGFILTESGKATARHVEQILSGKRPVVSKIESSRARDQSESLINHIKKSEAYKVYLAGKKNTEFISDSMIRALLGASLETSNRILQQNLNNCLNAAESLSDSDVVEFLKILKDKFKGKLWGD